MRSLHDVQAVQSVYPPSTKWEKQRLDFQILPRHKGLKIAVSPKLIEIQTVETAIRLREP